MACAAYTDRESSRVASEQEQERVLRDVESARVVREEERVRVYSETESARVFRERACVEGVEGSPLRISYGSALFAHYRIGDAQLINNKCWKLYDSSGNGNHATNVAGALFAARPTHVDLVGPNSTDALHFELPGLDSALRCVSPAGFYVGAVICVHALIKFVGTGTYNPWIVQGSSGGSGRTFNALRSSSADVLGNMWGTVATQDLLATSGTTSPGLGTWHVWSTQATAGGRAQVARDGVVQEQSAVGTAASVLTSSEIVSEIDVGRVGNDFYLSDLIICDADTTARIAARAAYYSSEFGVTI
jgi:hypothetical protein